MPAEIHRKELKTLVAQGRVQLVDVMPAEDYKKEHLPKAVNIPLERLRNDAARRLQREEAVIVYSRNYQCDLSARAAWHLESMGFHEVYRYTPGMADWQSAGWPTEGTEAKKPDLLQKGRSDVPICGLRDRLRDVKNRYAPGEQDTCVVVNDRNIVLGVLHGEIWNADPLSVVADIMDIDPVAFRPNEDSEEAMKAIRRDKAEPALITTSDGELLGILKPLRKKTHPRNAA
jgi:rhodanese-related sulfurtransferase